MPIEVFVEAGGHFGVSNRPSWSDDDREKNYAVDFLLARSVGIFRIGVIERLGRRDSAVSYLAYFTNLVPAGWSCATVRCGKNDAALALSKRQKTNRRVSFMHPPVYRIYQGRRLIVGPLLSDQRGKPKVNVN